MHQWITTLPSPVGQLLLASDGHALTGMWLEGQKYYPDSLTQQAEIGVSLPVFIQVQEWLQRYFAGEQPRPQELPLAPQGSPFRQLIWQLLCEIPYGTLTTYGALAAEAARRMNRQSMSAQAVGGAVGHNPISIIIPCHRVVGSTGSLTGYAGGISRKQWLLSLEGVEQTRLFVPTHGTAL